MKGSLSNDGTAGVLERRGAGLGLISSWSFLIKELLCLLCWCKGASSKDRTGVTQASDPSNILHHSLCVFCAKMDANFFFISGQSEKLNWLGSLLESSPRPERRKAEQLSLDKIKCCPYVSTSINILLFCRQSNAACHTNWKKYH